MVSFDPNDVWQDEIQNGLLDIITKGMDIAVDMQHMIGQSGFIDVKQDKTLVTKADKAVEGHIKTSLARLTPEVFFLGEETAQEIIKKKESLPNVFWLCDPIDGTSGYALGKSDYAITLALIVNSRPLFGIIALPYYREIIYTNTISSVCLRQEKDNINNLLGKNYVVKREARLILGPGRINSVSVYRELYKAEPSHVTQRASAMKFFELVKGNADVYIRERELCEWDVAAGDAIVHTLGGAMRSYATNDVVQYGNIKKAFRVEKIVADMRSVKGTI